MLKVGFLVWNEFQFFHVMSVLERFPETILIIEVRPGLRKRFPRIITRGLKNRIEFVLPTEARKIDGLVDAVVVQSNSSTANRLRQAKTVALQYSLSKEWHQYGKWMTEADLILCFGEYSRNRIRSAAPCVPVGNPRLERYGYLCPRILDRLQTRLDPAKRTIMLAPSWNDEVMISSLRRNIRSIERSFNVLWSPHHNSRIFHANAWTWASRYFTVYDRYLYYLNLADIVVSDTSGALFDAICVGKPAIVADFAGESRCLPNSIEFNQRSEIGPVARDIAGVVDFANACLDERIAFKIANDRLRRHCFADRKSVSETIMDAIVTRVGDNP